MKPAYYLQRRLNQHGDRRHLTTCITENKVFDYSKKKWYLFNNTWSSYQITMKKRIKETLLVFLKEKANLL